VSISPDGRYVAFVVGQAVYETNSYRSGLYVVGSAAGSVPICLGTAGAPRWDFINQWVPDPPQWSPDSRYITLLAKMDKGRSWQVWRWDIDGNPPTQLTKVPGDVQSYRWTADGGKIVVTFQRPKKRRSNSELSDRGILYDGGLNASRSRPVVSEVLASKHQKTETWIHDVATYDERQQTKAEADSVGPWVSDMGEEYFDATTLAGHHLLDAKCRLMARKSRTGLSTIPQAPKSSINCFLSPFVGDRPSTWRPVFTSWLTIGGLPTAVRFTLCRMREMAGRQAHGGTRGGWIT